jgi:hypothetical protein
MPHSYHQGAIHRISVRLRERLEEALEQKRITSITEDLIQGAIEAASIYEGLTPEEMRELEEKLKDVVGRVG